MDAKDRAYFLRRALQEQEAAFNASCAEARERHEELAAAYRFRCSQDAVTANAAIREFAVSLQEPARQSESAL